MAMLKTMFVGSDTPKPPKIPSTSSAQIQNAQDNARRAALLARGRSSTIIGGRGNNLGNVG